MHWRAVRRVLLLLWGLNMFKVYKRKIYVYQMRDGVPAFAWATNAYRTCRDAIAGAKARYPHQEFKANFAK